MPEINPDPRNNSVPAPVSGELIFHHPIRTRETDIVNVDVTINGAIVVRANILPETFSHISSVRLLVEGARDGEGLRTATAHRATTMEDIAAWIEGEGTDPQRVALADGIREGRVATDPLDETLREYQKQRAQLRYMKRKIDESSIDQRPVQEMRRHLASIAAIERAEVFELLTDGYCQHCGDVTPPTCHCMNDE